MSSPGVRAAQYVRMSTEVQDLSIEFQTVANAAYALDHGFEIVRTYADEGITGLLLTGRDGLKRLLSDVVGGARDFDAIIVYDVSRWGRFQNPDQAAHYEFLCFEAGVKVHYSAEPFSNDDSIASTIVKHVKRAMAAEFSRELSVRTKRAKALMRGRGLWIGGTPGYGFRRMVIGSDGRIHGQREQGQHKGAPHTHVRLALGPPDEVMIVRRIYRLFLRGRSCQEIADRLNSEGLPFIAQLAWTKRAVYRILKTEKYAGTLVFGRERGVLGGRSVVVPRDEWVRLPGGCPAIVSRRTFLAAQKQMKRKVPEDVLLDELAEFLRREGRLSQRLIDQKGRRASSTYLRRLGSFMEIYRRLGYQPSRRAEKAATGALARYMGLKHRPDLSDEDLVATLKELLGRAGHLSRRLIDSDRSLPCVDTFLARLGGLRKLYELAGYTPTAAQLAHLKGEP